MPNRYPAPCYRCGEMVPPGEGVFEKFGRAQRQKWPHAPRNIKWQVQHHTCAEKYRGTSVHYLFNPPTKKDTTP